MSQVTVPDSILGWKPGEIRNYKFWGCKVEADCRNENAVEFCLFLPDAQRVFDESAGYFDPEIEDIEECAQEWAAEAILKGLRDGKLTLSEVTR